ncbi:alpha/beta hydrolase family protein [Cupriavidus necator]|nr:alpha/beta hydrolase [Cupriavidus necator]
MMTTTVSSASLAFQRAMPVTRLLDCGMDYADAVRLFDGTGRGEDWDCVAESLAVAQLERAEHAARAGHLVTAAQAQSMAIADLVFAQMAFNHDAPRKVGLYSRLVAATHQLCHWSAQRLERVELPFANGRLTGWLMRPPAGHARGTVLLFGGQSGWGVAYLPLARALAERGLATLMAEGPGQGETRLVHGIHVDVDVPAAYRCFVSRITEDASLGVPGIWGNSVGGLWAAATAATDDRIRACCINGALAAPTLLPFRTFEEQAAAMLGSRDPAAIQANFERMRFHSHRDRISCPLLVLHGGADPLVKLEDQQPFLDAARTDDVTLRIWPDGEHTIYNHAAERTALVADWFADRLC